MFIFIVSETWIERASKRIEFPSRFGWGDVCLGFELAEGHASIPLISLDDYYQRRIKQKDIFIILL
jgi:hypothetical protein